ncbi:MAG: Gldg family protein, partial [Halobaculum sp.]
VAVGVVPALTATQSGAEPVELNNSEYAVDRIGQTAIPATGSINVSSEGEGTVVFDQSHANGYNREDIQPLVEALRRAGYDVRFHGRDDLAPLLEDAVAYVVIDAGTSFDREEIAAVRNFTEDGGRVAVFGEPNQVSVSATGLGGVQVTTERTRGDRLLSAYGLTFRTSYVYNQRINDGGFKNPITSPVGPAGDAGSRVPVYTATRVVSLDGEGQPILRLPEGSRTSGGDASGQFPVAYQDGNVLAVGDTDLLGVGRYNVADTEQFLAYVVEFLLSSDRATDVNEESAASDGSTANDDEDSSESVAAPAVPEAHSRATARPV